MRQLASIRVITDIKPIEGRDKIVLALVDGWSVIVKKDEYQIGDKTIFCEPDSILPEKPEFEFLRSKKFRIKTMKMAGVISQGICFPLSFLPEGDYQVGDDVTELMGITQYEATMDKEPEPSAETERLTAPKRKYPAFLMRRAWFRELVSPKPVKAGFPDFISKTDEVRIQNSPYFLDWDCEWVATEKVDGQSGSFTLKRIKGKHFWNRTRYDFSVCSRNYRQMEKNSTSYWQVAERYQLEKVLHQLIGEKEWVAIQGECVAPTVQGNKYHVTKADLYVFNLIYPDGRVGSMEAKEKVEACGLKFVPVVSEKVRVKGMSVAEVLEYATGKSQLADTLREGIVFRSMDGKQSFKAVSPEFLIRYNV
ncbi:MAG: RNA ligase family protein [bacterium]|nr:RNA ligase family protein [bacterium]